MTTKTKDTTIIRAPRDTEHPYFMLRRATAQDHRLSFEARGVLAYLLSKPGNWRIQESDLQTQGGCGRDKVRRILRQLEKYGYLMRQRQRGETGIFAPSEYLIYEAPQTENTSMVQPRTEKPSPDNPRTGKPSPENTSLKEYRDTKSTDSTVETRESTDADSTVPEASTDPTTSAEPLTASGEDAQASVDSIQESPPKKRTRKKTPRDLLAEKLIVLFGINRAAMTKTAWSNMARIASELLAAGATVDDMPGFYGWCKMQGWNSFTENAMAKHWPAYEKTLKPPAPSEPRPTLPPRDPSCAMCRGNSSLMDEHGATVPCPACIAKMEATTI